MRAPQSGGWQQRVLQAVLLILAVALASRVVAELLAPLLPALIALVCSAAILWFVLRRGR
jgi:hypothetical protein